MNSLHCSRLYSDLKDSIEQFRLHLLERDELTPLKVWQVQELSYQAAQRIIQVGPQKALNIMVDSSQNFPLAARSLSRQVVLKEFISEVILRIRNKISCKRYIVYNDCSFLFRSFLVS